MMYPTLAGLLMITGYEPGGTTMAMDNPMLLVACSRAEFIMLFSSEDSWHREAVRFSTHGRLRVGRWGG